MPNGYDPQLAVDYAKKWALGRNPDYLDFHTLGGDCTNFISQCLYAGCAVMNFTPVYGWYYRTGNDRTASWTGVEYLYRFLTQNQGAGPYAQEVSLMQAHVGDVIQLAQRNAAYTHTGLIVARNANGELFLAAHTNDVWMQPLSAYRQPLRRVLHILGARRM